MYALVFTAALSLCLVAELSEHYTNQCQKVQSYVSTARFQVSTVCVRARAQFTHKLGWRGVRGLNQTFSVDAPDVRNPIDMCKEAV